MSIPTPQSNIYSSIDPATTLGPATLAVADAERSLAFYRDLLGMEVVREDASQIELGVPGTTLLRLMVQPGLRPSSRTHTGLYHAAILLPSRLDLAHVLRRLLEIRYPIGASDHLVSEALYLDDPDANGLEIYRDRPRDKWRYQPNGDIAMDTLRLDLGDVLGEIQSDGTPWSGMPGGTRIGHMHLRVGDIAQAEAFYSGVLGFDVMTHYPGALFVSAGGYHHHLGLNTWESRGATPAPPDTAGLRSFVVVLPNKDALEQVQTRITAAGLSIREQGGFVAVDDPWKNTLLLQTRIGS